LLTGDGSKPHLDFRKTILAQGGPRVGRALGGESPKKKIPALISQRIRAQNEEWSKKGPTNRGRTVQNR